MERIIACVAVLASATCGLHRKVVVVLVLVLVLVLVAFIE